MVCAADLAPSINCNRTTNQHEYSTANETLKLLKPCNKGLKIKCWESFYIQIYQQRNRLITDHVTGDYNPLYEQAFIPHDLQHIPRHSLDQINEELNDLFSLPNTVRVVKSRRMRWAGHVACMGEDRGVHRVLVGKPEGKRPLGRPRHRWEDNSKMDLQEVGGGRGDWMELAEDRDRWRALVGTVRDFRVP